MNTQEVIQCYDDIIDSFLLKFNNRFSEVLDTIGIRHIQLTHGDRLRPQMCLWGFLASIDLDDITTDNFNEIIELSVAIELLHKSSLLLDDWIDDDSKRRGQSAFHTDYGAKQTVLYALNIVGWSIRIVEDMLQKSKVTYLLYAAVIRNFVNTIINMSSGVLQELQIEKDDLFNKERIKEITELQTSSIIHHSLMCGYILGCGLHGKTNELLEKELAKISSYCGFHFQYCNDLEAFINQSSAHNHKGNINLDITKLRKNLIIASLGDTIRFYDKKKFTNGNVDDLLCLANKYDIINRTINDMQTSRNGILTSVKKIEPECFSKEWHIGFTNFILKLFEYAEQRLHR